VVNYHRKKKGVIDIKVERNLVFEKQIDGHLLKDSIADLRRELAFLLNRFDQVIQHEVSH
jgi:hypothetical protein